MAEHFDRCLGCMACVDVCPSGVRYDHVIDAARDRVERGLERPLADRLHRGFVFSLFPYPGRLRVAAVLLWLWQVSGLRWLFRRLGLLRLSRRLAQLDALAPPIALRAALASLPDRVAAHGERRLKVGLVTGCVQGVFFPGVNAATVRVLAAEGVEVVVPRPQGCCGALSAHAGRLDEARRLARALVETFEHVEVDAVVVNAAGCGSHLKDLEHLFEGYSGFAPRAAAFAARIRDASELLVGLAPRAPRAPIAARVAYHSPCHIEHAQHVGDAPRRLRGPSPASSWWRSPMAIECCGSAGIYNLVEPESAEAIGRRKADAVLATGAPLLASANPGCTLHVRKMLEARGAHIEAAHPLELLDRAIAQARRS